MIYRGENKLSKLSFLLCSHFYLQKIKKTARTGGIIKFHCPTFPTLVVQSRFLCCFLLVILVLPLFIPTLIPISPLLFSFQLRLFPFFAWSWLVESRLKTGDKHCSCRVHICPSRVPIEADLRANNRLVNQEHQLGYAWLYAGFNPECPGTGRRTLTCMPIFEAGL